MSSEQWYTAILVLQSKVLDSRDRTPIVDLQWTLLHAPDPDAAYTKALALGQGLEHSYENEDGNTVLWKFCGIHDLVDLVDPPADGTEVYYRLSQQPAEDVIRQKQDLPIFSGKEWDEVAARDLFDRLDQETGLDRFESDPQP